MKVINVRFPDEDFKIIKSVSEFLSVPVATLIRYFSLKTSKKVLNEKAKEEIKA